MIALLLTAVLSHSSEAQDESGFLLQEDGEVRVHRGIDAGTNVEPDPLPEESDVGPGTTAAAEAEPSHSEPEAEPKKTREAAIQRARDRGIPTNRAATRKKRSAESGKTRREAVARSRERGVPTHRAADRGWKPYNARGTP